ncbi:hypothetical protein HDE_04919 [Halotydeus destructor]|nr:hypothetical protein HDE_04919 [Halotydeus destructor]
MAVNQLVCLVVLITALLTKEALMNPKPTPVPREECNHGINNKEKHDLFNCGFCYINGNKVNTAEASAKALKKIDMRCAAGCGNFKNTNDGHCKDYKNFTGEFYYEISPGVDHCVCLKGHSKKMH